MSGWAYGFGSRQPHHRKNPETPVFARVCRCLQFPYAGCSFRSNDVLERHTGCKIDDEIADEFELLICNNVDTEITPLPLWGEALLLISAGILFFTDDAVTPRNKPKTVAACFY